MAIEIFFSGDVLQKQPRYQRSERRRREKGRFLNTPDWAFRVLDNLDGLRYYMFHEHMIAFVRIMGYRSTVGRLTLNQLIEVRILVPQPHGTAREAVSKDLAKNSGSCF